MTFPNIERPGTKIRVEKDFRSYGANFKAGTELIVLNDGLADIAIGKHYPWGIFALKDSMEYSTEKSRDLAAGIDPQWAGYDPTHDMGI